MDGDASVFRFRPECFARTSKASRNAGRANGVLIRVYTVWRLECRDHALKGKIIAKKGHKNHIRFCEFCASLWLIVFLGECLLHFGKLSLYRVRIFRIGAVLQVQTHVLGCILIFLLLRED